MREFSNTSVKTKKQMAGEYGVCSKTFVEMLKRNNISIERRLITPKEQELIYTVLGIPQNSHKFPKM
jgi:hypothetical protein